MPTNWLRDIQEKEQEQQAVKPDLIYTLTPEQEAWLKAGIFISSPDKTNTENE